MCKEYNNTSFITGFGFCISESEEELWKRILFESDISNDLVIKRNVNVSKSEIEYDKLVVSPKVFRRMDKQVVYQLVATDRVFKKCDKILWEDVNKIGVFSGSLFAQLEFGMTQMTSLITSGNKNEISMYTGVSFYYGATCGEVSLLLGTKGENLAICTGANSGIDSVIEGHNSIKREINNTVLCVAGENLSEDVISDMLPRQEKGDNVIKESRYIYRSGAISALLSNNKHSANGVNIEVVATYQVNDSSSLFSCGDNFKATFQSAIKKCLQEANLSIDDIDLIIPGINNSKQYDICELQVLQTLLTQKQDLLYTPIPIVGDYLSASGILKVYTAHQCMINHCIPQNRRTDFNKDNIKPYEALFNWERKNNVDIHYAMIIQRDVVSGRISLIILRNLV